MYDDLVVVALLVLYLLIDTTITTQNQRQQEHATINVNGHDDSLLIAKRDGKDKAKLLESHAFRCAPVPVCACLHSVCLVIACMQGHPKPKL